MNGKRIFSSLIITGVMLSLIIGTGAQSHQAVSQPPDQRLEGSWIITVTEEKYQSYYTFTSGGGVIVTGNEGLTGHGEWMRTGDREFALTWFGQALIPYAFRCQEAVTLNETLNELNGHGRCGYVNLETGAFVPEFPPYNKMLKGKRLRVEPLPR